MTKFSAYVLAAVLTASAFSAAPAQATGGGLGKSEDTRVVSVRFSQPAATAPAASLEGTPSSRGCRRVSGTLTGYNIWRQPQWSMTMTPVWCWSAGRIVDKYSDAGVSAPGRLWKFHKWIANSSDSTRPTRWVRYRQAYFAQCVEFPGGGSLCGNKAYPWMRFSLYHDGTWHIEHS